MNVADFENWFKPFRRRLQDGYFTPRRISPGRGNGGLWIILSSTLVVITAMALLTQLYDDTALEAVQHHSIEIENPQSTIHLFSTDVERIAPALPLQPKIVTTDITHTIKRLQDLEQWSKNSKQPPPFSDIASIDKMTNEIDKQALIRIIEQWRQAWASGDVESYLSFYSDNFNVTGKFESLSQWQQIRRLRVTQQRKISLELDDLKLEVTNGQAVANFLQSYHSTSFSNTVHKKLTFIREQTGWRIVSEEIRGE